MAGSGWGTVLDADDETARVIVPADDPMERLQQLQRVSHAAIRAIHAPEPARKAFGPDDLVRGYAATFDTPEGHQLVGTVIDWGPKGARLHVLDTVGGDHVRKVDFAAIRAVRPGTEAALERATRPPQPGDLVNVTTPAGVLLDGLVSPPDRQGTVEITLDDGRRLRVYVTQISGIRPQAGQAQLEALRGRTKGRRPGVAVLQRLARALDVAVTEFLR